MSKTMRKLSFVAFILLRNYTLHHIADPQFLGIEFPLYSFLNRPWLCQLWYPYFFLTNCEIKERDKKI